MSSELHYYSNFSFLFQYYWNFFQQITLERCLSLSTQLIETIEVHLEANNCQSALEYLSVNVALISSLIEFSCDPRNALNITFMTIQQNSGEIDDDTLDYMLITMSQIVRNIPPFYLRSALDIVKVLVRKCQMKYKC